VVVCFLSPGNAYPVIEKATEPSSLMGTPLKAGYQSHYVSTKKDGTPCEKPRSAGKFFDELVINQETQVVPAYIVHFERSALTALVKEFQRDVPLPAGEEGVSADEMELEMEARTGGTDD